MADFITAGTILITGSIFWWALLIISFNKDRSRYRNCYFLFFALFFTAIAAMFCLEKRFPGTIVYSVIQVGLILLLVPVFLVINGIIMYRKEGHSIGNMLSFIFGIVIGTGEISTLYIMFTGTVTEHAYRYHEITVASQVISISVIYFSVSFLVFMFYSLFLMIIPRKSDFDYVIIHGSGLIDGSKVSKLLSDRIDKAILVYSTDPSPTILIPSGGKGGDETISEAEAMAEYLRKKGIPDSDILPEDKSATTIENLKFSKALIDAREGRKYTALVTSNYHVYRALRYCRRIGLKCTGIGSHVAPYYWPSALIREYIAIHAEKKHLISLLAGWIIVLIMFIPAAG